VLRPALHLAVVGIALLWMTPTAGLLVSSFRDGAAVAGSGWWTAFLTPLEFTMENYHEVLTRNRMGAGLLNSLAIAVPGTIMPILVSALAAYAFAWMRFPGRRALFAAVVALMVVPVQMTLIPVLRLLAHAGLVGTFTAVWMAHTAYGLPFAVFLLHNFFRSLPRELLESAWVEGGSHLTVFFRIVLPLSVPGVASLAIFQFLWVWNDLLVALVILQDPAKAPLTMAITSLVSSYGTQWQLLTAAAFISMVLPLIIFFTLQRYFVRGILSGAVKG